ARSKNSGESSRYTGNSKENGADFNGHAPASSAFQPLQTRQSAPRHHAAHRVSVADRQHARLSNRASDRHAKLPGCVRLEKCGSTVAHSRRDTLHAPTVSARVNT